MQTLMTTKQKIYLNVTFTENHFRPELYFNNMQFYFLASRGGKKENHNLNDFKIIIVKTETNINVILNLPNLCHLSELTPAVLLIQFGNAGMQSV